MTGDIGRVLWILLAAVGVVLLIACANVANLFLVRAEGRQQELAMRAALGASRGRIARELLSETVLLGLAAGALGLVFTEAAIGLLRRMAPARLPRVDEIGIDPAVLLFTLAISLLTGVLFGLIPVLRFGAADATALKEGGRSASDAPAAAAHAQRAGRGGSRAGAGAVDRLGADDSNVRRHAAGPSRLHPPGGGADVPASRSRRTSTRDEEQFARTHEQIAQRLAQVPGVVSVGLSSSITMDGEDNSNPLFVEHVDVPEGQLPPLRRFKTVAPGYFETMGNPDRGGTRHHLDRHLPAPAGRRHLRDPRAGVLAEPRRMRSASACGDFGPRGTKSSAWSARNATMA